MAIVDQGKVREYLLSASHPVGRFKAKFFASLGFGPEDWPELVAALRLLAVEGEAQAGETSPHGDKYLVFGTLTGPTGMAAEVVSVWISGGGGASPRLVTVYPR